jgi:stalled ribosome alternative rescue factor ArfA
LCRGRGKAVVEELAAGKGSYQREEIEIIKK